MKRIISILITLSVLTSALLLSACACQHNWCEATCTAPRTCSKCGATEGEPIGHLWEEATCIVPKTCTKCGATEGEPDGHLWKEANCTYPATCTKCGEKTGTASGKHSRRQGICEYCGTYIDELATQVEDIEEAFQTMLDHVQAIRLTNFLYGTSARMSVYTEHFDNISTAFCSMRDIVDSYPDDFAILKEPINILEELILSTIDRYNSSVSATQKLSILLEFCTDFHLSGQWSWSIDEYYPVIRILNGSDSTQAT